MTADVTGRTVLVTGSTDGLGRALALELAAGGASVLLHGRDPVKVEKTVRDIREATGNERLAFYLADLSSLSEVCGLAEQVLAEHERLDVLVNNAGIGRGDGRREVSADGYELRFAVMYLAPHLLTHLLEPLLVDSAPARIVNVASAGQAPVDFDDLMLDRGYSGTQAYCRARDADPRSGRSASGQRRHRELPAPRDVHADEDGARGRNPAGRLARERRRGDDASCRGSGARGRDRHVLRPNARGSGPGAGV